MTPITHRTPSCYSTAARRSGLQLLITLAATLPIALPIAVSAQVNVEALRQDDPPLGRSGTFGGDLTVRTGNVQLVQLNLNARLYKVTESVTTLIVGAGDSACRVGPASRRRVCSTIERRTGTTISSRRSGTDS